MKSNQKDFTQEELYKILSSTHGVSIDEKLKIVSIPQLTLDEFDSEMKFFLLELKYSGYSVQYAIS